MKISELTHSDIGREVSFTYNHGEIVYGHLSSWNDTYVFVRFKGPNGEACDPDRCAFTMSKSKC